jgi:uncharacterized membrane protein
MTSAEPIPKNLRGTLIKAIEEMPEEQLVAVHQAMLEAEVRRLRQLISEDAEREQAEGKWDRLNEVIRQYRDRRKAGRDDS